MATNLIHILDIFYSLTKKDNFEISSLNLKKLKAKRKGYNELSGNLNIRNNNGYLRVYDNSKFKHHTLNIQNRGKNFVLQINKKKQCFFYINKKLTKIFKFPMAKDYTENFYRKSLKSSDLIFNNYDRSIFLSQKILLFIKSKFDNFNLT